MDNDNWIEEFYAGLEKHLNNYTRPVDWLERMQRAQSTARKPVKCQHEGRSSKFKGEGYE
jgi:hypothetical protein